MNSDSLRAPCWRSATPRARQPRLTHFKTMAAFMTDQMLLFWPPYRNDEDCACCRGDWPPGDLDEGSR
jgi:hypothetical protein